MSITSVSSITSRKTAQTIPDLPYAYYTFNTSDVTGTDVFNVVSQLYDASLSTAGLLDGSNNICGTTDLSLNSSSSQFVTINSPMDVGKTTGMSIMFWVRYGTNNANGTRIFDLGNNPASDNIEIYIDSIGIPVLSIYVGSTQYTYSFGYPVNYNIYRHLGITMTLDGTFKYYIDGVLYKTTTGNQYPADVVRTKNYIGKSSNNALYFNGAIGEFRVYNNAVSSAIVLTNMNTNVRLYTNSYMTHNYAFKYSDLANGKIKNLATGVYDASFLTPVDTTFTITSATKQIGITTGTQKNNQLAAPVPITSRINSNFLYNLPTAVTTGTAPASQSTDINYGVRITSGFVTPATGGFTINFWFYNNVNASVYDIPYFSFNDISTINRRIVFGMNGSNYGASTTALPYVHIYNVPYEEMYLSLGNTGMSNATANSGWWQYSLVVDYNAQTIRSYINFTDLSMTNFTSATTNMYSHTYRDYSNTTFSNCLLMVDTPEFRGANYARPIRGFMDNFRVYNVPLKLYELRQLAQIPIIPNSRAYTLRSMTAAAPVNGNVAICMDNSVNLIYLSAGVGNLYVGNVSTNTWTQSTLAGGSAGQLHNRNWRDIVCNGTGQYVIACVRTYMGDPSGVVFYSSDYGSTYTQSASTIDTSYCFNLAMSNDGNYSYMTAWGVPTPQTGGSVNNAYGNLFTSTDKGVTWSRITTVSGTGLTSGTSWASMPAQVRCNITGEYVVLGIYGAVSTQAFLSNYGSTLMNTPLVGTYGLITTNPLITTRASDSALIINTVNSGPTSAQTWGMSKSVITVVAKTIISQNTLNTPIFGGIAPQTTSFFPWTGARNLQMASDRKTIMMVDTAGLGNVFVSTNGLSTAPWPESANTSGVSCFGDVINLSVPNPVSAIPVPRSAWSGLYINWNDQFAFASKTGTVYIYSWTQQ